MSWLRKVPGMDIFLTKQIFITVDVAFGLYLLEFELRYVASSKRKGKGVKYIMSLCCAFLRRCWKDKSLYANVCFTQFRYILKYNFWILWNRSHNVHWTLLRYLACKRCNARCVRIGLAVRPSLWNSLLLSSEAGLAGPMLTLTYRGFLIKTKKKRIVETRDGQAARGGRHGRTAGNRRSRSGSIFRNGLHSWLFVLSIMIR